MESTERQKREKVLVVAHADNHLEIFAAKHVDVKIVRCPASFTDEMKGMAEDFVEQTLPPAWRSLYFPGFCRKSEMLRPLLPSTIQDAKLVRGLLKTLNSIGDAA